MSLQVQPRRPENEINREETAACHRPGSIYGALRRFCLDRGGLWVQVMPKDKIPTVAHYQIAVTAEHEFWLRCSIVAGGRPCVRMAFVRDLRRTRVLCVVISGEDECSAFSQGSGILMPVATSVHELFSCVCDAVECGGGTSVDTRQRRSRPPGYPRSAFLQQ